MTELEPRSQPIVSARVTADEVAVLDEAAALGGLTRSEYIRAVLLESPHGVEINRLKIYLEQVDYEIADLTDRLARATKRRKAILARMKKLED